MDVKRMKQETDRLMLESMGFTSTAAVSYTHLTLPTSDLV